MRVVLDTNPAVSALVFRGRLAVLRAAWQGGRLVPLVCRETVLELIRVMAYPKFRLGRDAQQALVAEYLPWCETAALPDPPPAVPHCEDRDDLVFLRLAVAHNVPLASGDGVVRALRGKLAVPVLTAAELLDRADWPG